MKLGIIFIETRVWVGGVGFIPHPFSDFNAMRLSVLQFLIGFVPPRYECRDSDKPDDEDHDANLKIAKT